jgi:O-Antigen ligase
MQAAVEAIKLPVLGAEWLKRAAAVSFVALVCGALAVRSTQLAVTVVLLVLLLGIRWRSRSAGIATLWVYWLLIPGLRRVLDIAAPAPGADPLSLFPFLATGMLALVELRHIHLDQRARLILATAGASLALGIPMGMLAEPQAAVYALFAYGTGVAAFVIGWGDGINRADTLERVLQVLLPAIAIYSVAQYLMPLTSWDSHWVATSEIASIKAPGQTDHIRVFGTLNSYFTLAIVLSVGLMIGLGKRRPFALTALVFTPLILALVFTFNRSAWLGLVVGLIVFITSVRKGGVGRVLGIILVCVGVVFVLGSSNPTTKAFTERITSLGSPGKDVSTQDRLATTEKLLPESISQPLGAGIGQAGIASERIGGSKNEQLANIDDGYLSALYQGGPFALLFLLVAIGLSLGCGLRAVRLSPPEERQHRSAQLAVLVMLVVVLVSGEVLYGISGAIFWYMAGIFAATVFRDAQREENQPADRTTVCPWESSPS